jgi:hemoglobin/transferrin/lactoferrin receptor protein
MNSVQQMSSLISYISPFQLTSNVRITCIITFIVFGFMQLSAQVLKVSDESTGRPLKHATITCEDPSVATTTDNAGQAQLSRFGLMQQITVRMLGYDTLTLSYEQLAQLNFSVALHPKGIPLNAINVIAFRVENRNNLFLLNSLSIDQKHIQYQQPQTTADLLGGTGGVFIQKSQQGGGSPMIRGYAANRLLYTVDGVRMNTAIFRGGNLQNVISLDALATEKTEVLFGPGQVMYGSDAIGGVMNFTTLIATLSDTSGSGYSGNALARYSTANNEKTAHFDIEGRFNTWAFVTSISHNNFDHLRMGSRGPDEYLRPFYVVNQHGADEITVNKNPLIQVPSGYKQLNLMQKFSYAPSPAWSLHYGFHYSATSDYSRYDRHIRYKNGFPRYGEWNYGPQLWLMNNLSAENNSKLLLSDRFTLRLAHQLFEESRISRNINTPLRQTRHERVDAFSLNLEAEKRVFSNIDMAYGAEVVINDVQSSGTDNNIVTGITTEGPSRYPQALWSSYAAYLSGSYPISERLLTSAGVRYSYQHTRAVFDTRFYPFPFTDVVNTNDALTGSMEIRFTPVEGTILSVTGSTGFRAPNVDDLGKVFDSAPGLVVVPNPALKPEYVWNAEASVLQRVGTVAQVNISAFYSFLTNAIVRRDFQFNGLDTIVYDGEPGRVQALQNAAFARIYGFQAAMQISLPSNFSIRSTLNYHKGVEETDDGMQSPSRHAPPLFGRTSIDYSKRKVQLAFYTEYSGAKTFEQLPEEEKNKPEIYAVDKNGNPWSPAWLTLNASATYNFNNRFKMVAAIENITDERYKSYSSGIVAPGRNFRITLQAMF